MEMRKKTKETFCIGAEMEATDNHDKRNDWMWEGGSRGVAHQSFI
jgi:hypothetical protein